MFVFIFLYICVSNIFIEVVEEICFFILVFIIVLCLWYVLIKFILKKKDWLYWMVVIKFLIEEMLDLNINIKYEWYIYLLFIVLYILIYWIFLFYIVLKKKN